MVEYDSYTCENCGEAFKALEGANAVETGYCSPKCETSAKS
jgi:DNA-directed RNA polymerase subunit RPC12/RpoP